VTGPHFFDKVLALAERGEGSSAVDHQARFAGLYPLKPERLCVVCVAYAGDVRGHVEFTTVEATARYREFLAACGVQDIEHFRRAIHHHALPIGVLCASPTYKQLSPEPHPCGDIQQCVPKCGTNVRIPLLNEMMLGRHCTRSAHA
jgi:hypothetical protein